MKKRKLKDLLLEEMRRRQEAENQLELAAEGLAEGVLQQHKLDQERQRLEKRVAELEARTQGLAELALSAWKMTSREHQASHRWARWKNRAWELSVDLQRWEMPAP